jgi:hypothetical protein
MEKKSLEEIKKVVTQFKKDHPEILEESSETRYLL